MKRVKSHALKAQKNEHKNGQKTGLHANAIRAKHLQKRDMQKKINFEKDKQIFRCN